MDNSQETSHLPRTPFAFFLYVAKPYKWWMWSAICLVIFASAAWAGTAYFFKLIIDAVEVGDKASALRYGILYPMALLGVELLYRASGLAASHVTVKTVNNTTVKLTEYLLRHNHNYFINRFAGSITSKIRNVTGAIENIVPDFLWSQLSSAIAFSVTFILILSVDLQAGFIFILLLMALALVNKSMATKKALVARASAEAGTALQGGLSDIVGNMSTVRQYAQTVSELNRILDLSTKKQEWSLKSWLYTEKLLTINSVVIFIFAIYMFWLLTTKWSNGVITAGDFVLVLALVSQMVGSLVFIGRSVNATARAIGELREGLDDLLISYDITDIEKAKTLAIESGKIAWNNVVFKYESGTVFDNFNLNIPAKQRLGLVGHSGAGKTTFVSLLLRQHDLDAGVITLDEQDISQVTQDSLRQAIAVVPQEPMLFHRSIRENIAYAKPNATLDEVIAVAKLAHAHDFISGLPEGYETLVGERGVKLSGGQKQRVAIARAMLKNAPILILDEATSALDSESEQMIQAALHTLMQGKTVIAIAHRLSTLREMDRIVVLEDGKIIEDGNHESLREAEGLYARLWSHQSGGFLLE